MPWPARVVPHPPSTTTRAYASAVRRAGASGFLAKDELTGDVLRQLIEGG